MEILKQVKKDMKHIPLRAWLLILIGTLTWSITMVKSGLVYSYGMGFWGPNGHDGVWHISLAKSLADGSWNIPMFAGETIRNYHIGFDLLLAVLHKITFIPIVNLYFQFLPPIFALLTGILIYKFVYTWQRDRSKAYWATFFVYFGGSFGWVLTYLRNGDFGGESIFWSQQSLSTLINPPFALSLIFVFSGLNLLIQGLRDNNKKYLTVATFLFGLLVQIKVYAGILVLGGLFVSGLWRTIQRKGISLFKVFTGALIISILIFSPINNSSGDFVVIKPFWFLETMMGLSDRVGWQKFGEAMVNYKLGGVWFKGIAAYSTAFVIFIIGNMGTRVVGGVWVIRKLKKIKKLNYIDVFVLSIIAAGIVLPMFFVQRGTAWNTVQFFYYSLVFMGIIAGVVFANLLSKLGVNGTEKTGMQLKIRTRSVFIYKYLVIGIFLLLTIPPIVATLRHYLPTRPPAKISIVELEALEFLSKQPDGVVLTQPFDKKAAGAAVSNPPRPLYLYESTAYVSAFSGKEVYMEDEVNLEITGYDWRGRREEVGKILRYKDIRILRDFLEKNNITYIYWTKNSNSREFWDDKGLEKIFSNKKAYIYNAKELFE
jgi:hypothetical protein